ASTVGLIGSGAQARGQLRAVAEVRDLDSVRVYSTTPENREGFASEMNDYLNCEIEAVGSSSAAVSGADVVITATNAPEPVFDGDLLEPGTHVTAMGQYDTKKHELDSTTVSRAKYVLDLRERMSLDAGSLMAAFDEGAIDGDHLHGELGEVLAGVVPGREREEEITVFDSGGTGIETVAAASMLYECAREAGRGTEIEFAPASEAMPGR
ncbi:MAG: ornithine cyclodeaminase family protein, partial [Euryarchaeota archaeon]|nr:ornithine cyclodeaminase family protein [Euryarchaeota archaeon]